MTINIDPETISILQGLVWTDPDTRSSIQKYGCNILPVNFYSSTPSIEEIQDSFEYTADASPPYLDPEIFDEELLKKTLTQLFEYSDEFCPQEEGSEENPQGFFGNNSQFSYSDAMSYYCFIRSIKPSNIVEIGSSFSTLIALEACQKNKSGKIHCVEPYPRPFLVDNNQVQLYKKKAQEVSSEFLNDTLQDNDILFIDSTQTVKTGSDCLHIYLRLPPKIRKNLFVHAHDIFLPYGLPQNWLLEKQIFWTEQYLQCAFLTDNKKARVLYGSYYNAKTNPLLIKS